MTNKLAEYGHTFQVKSIACLMTDIGFMGQIYDILDESHFDNDALKWVVKECKLYYNEYKKPITLDVFKVKVNDINNDILKTTVVEKLKEIFRYHEAPDLDFIKDQSINFFKNSIFHSLTLSGTVSFIQITLGTPTSFRPIFGSGEITVRAEKLVLLPAKLCLILPSLLLILSVIVFSG